MSKKKLTREQHLAFAKDRHIAVTANAGSGKTTVLIDKYIDILLNDKKVAKDPTRILAITFTRVAASEMFLRTAKVIDKYIDQETDSIKLRILYEIRDKLSYAKITTIHSFCSSLLRDYPIEANIPPNFVELSEFDIFILQDEALELVFEELLDEDNPQPQYKLLFDNYGLAKIKELVTNIINQPDIFIEIIDFYNDDSNTILNNYNRIISEEVYKLMETFSILISKNNEYPKKVAGFNNLCEKFNNSLLELIKNEKVTDLFINKIINILETKVDGKSFFITFIGKHTNSKELTEEIKTKLKFYSNGINEEQTLQLINDARLFVEITKKYFELFQQLKDELSGIDFDDMIFKVREMLKDEETAKRVRAEYDYILVDEFQDTNIAQYEIIKSLVPTLQDSDLELDARCFIVGDGKQSIYRFRSADVRVFMEAIENIKNFNSNQINKALINPEYTLPESPGFDSNQIKIIPNNDSEKLGSLKLSCSFRLMPVPAAFVNFVFNKIEPTQLSEYDIKYENLVCGREIDALFEHIDNNQESIELDEKFGSVELLLNLVNKSDELENNTEEKEESIVENESSESEANMLARHILQLTNSTEETGTSNSKIFNYGDIAVLARNRKGFSALVSAFISHKIPYIIQSGQGFFSSQEIIDLTEFIKFLSNQNDDLAFASILASPFFGFTIDELFEISILGKKGDHLFDKFRMFLEQSKESMNYSKYGRCFEIIEMLKFHSTRIPISQLLTKIIETGGYWGVIANSPAGKQIAANFNKIVQFARDFEQKGFKTLNDFIVELEQLSQSSKEPEAVQQTNENAVKIITIHGAKGAEFPVVYLYSTNFRRNYDSEPFLNEKTGLTFKLRASSSPEVEEKILPIYSISKQYNNEAAIAEERRVLYVALTRAIHKLIITGELKIKKGAKKYTKPSMFLHYILTALELDFEEDLKIENMFGQNQFFGRMINEKLTVLRNDSFEKANTKFYVPVSYQVEAIEVENYAIIENRFDHILMMEPISGKISNTTLSPTKLMNFQADFDAYFIMELLGFSPDDLNSHEKSDSYPEDELEVKIKFGALPGTIIHEALEQINLWLNDDGSINNVILDDSINQSLIKNNAQGNTEIAQRVATECFAIAQTKLIQRNIKGLRKSQAELNLTMPIGDDFLTGSIDLLIETAEGTIEIWDWKSNRISSSEDLFEMKNKYQIQMLSYIYFLMHLHPNKDTYTARLLLTNCASPNSDDIDWTISFNYSYTDKEKIEIELFNLIQNSKFK